MPHRLLLLLLCCAGQLMAASFTAFADVPYTGEWQTQPPEEQVLVGQQRFWFVVPASLRQGSLGGSGTLSLADDGAFRLLPNSVWGDYSYELRLLGEVPEAVAGDAKALQRKAVQLKAWSWHELAQLAGREVLIGGRVERLVEPGRRFEWSLTFAEGDLRFAVELVASHDKKARMPDVQDLRYGPHAKHVIDLYYPAERGDEPLPVIVNIHGGGWGALHKDNVIGGFEPLTQGYAIASVAYRYVSEANNPPGSMHPPVTAPLYDAARAIQHLRYHAEELGLDPTRFGATGGSAGGCTTIWLALHDDLAIPDHDDPISRMSTRLQAAIPIQAQTSLDPIQVREWVPAMSYGGHAFFDDLPRDRSQRYDAWLARRAETLDWIAEFSPYAQASADDPPLFACNLGRRNVPDEDPTHHPMHTLKLVERLRELGAPAWFWAENQDSDEPRYNGRAGMLAFWDDHLKAAGQP